MISWGFALSWYAGAPVQGNESSVNPFFVVFFLNMPPENPALNGQIEVIQSKKHSYQWLRNLTA
jgi:hypothetical protein